ncbi:hypothetical protein [Halobacteriovorax sp. HLS]|uniref:hypothetical protein n=1 Tax=Halobacteriovorax sp. HLS TaxID=2234000 RepID=UPI0013E2AA33|nr:hypothetical protein [Halobacteriovorax sp. HLS]
MRCLNYIKILVSLSAILSCLAINAEYRVYQYYVKSRIQLPVDNKGYLVTSTLDPVSYLSYHGGNSSIRVDMLRSWMCKGHTGNFQTPCNGPEENSGAIIRQ